MRQAKSRITDHERETAVKVLMQSRQVTKWVESEAKFLGIDLNSSEGKEFWERESRAAALRAIE